MIKGIKVKLDVIEGMDYYWKATSEKEKVGESFINDIASMPEMSYTYDDEFTSESVRRALSAVSNRERFTSENKKEGRFWNYNMWVMEDLDYTDMMIKPVKVLNLSALIEKLNGEENKGDYEYLEVIFVPGHLDECYIVDNKLIINFFMVKPDLYDDDKVFFGEAPLVDFIEGKLKELLTK